MTAGLGSTVALETLADLLDHLGGIAPERVRLSPAPGTATEEDVLYVHDHAGRLCELVDGVLVEKAMGFRESFLAAALIIILGNFVRPRNLGLVTAPDGMVRLAAGLVRIPAVAFISWDRLPNRRVPTAPIPALAPNLAVEVLSAEHLPAKWRGSVVSILPQVCNWSGWWILKRHVPSLCIRLLRTPRSCTQRTP